MCWNVKQKVLLNGFGCLSVWSSYNRTWSKPLSFLRWTSVVFSFWSNFQFTHLTQSYSTLHYWIINHFDCKLNSISFNLFSDFFSFLLLLFRIFLSVSFFLRFVSSHWNKCFHANWNEIKWFFIHPTDDWIFIDESSFSIVSVIVFISVEISKRDSFLSLNLTHSLSFFKWL